MIETHEPASSETATAGLMRAIQNITRHVEEENAALRICRTSDLQSTNARKSRLLYDIMCASRVVEPVLLDGTVRDALIDLKTVLGQNIKKYKTHSAAVREISELIMAGMREYDSDGTYSCRSSDLPSC